jgi:hypothetical protein
MRHACVARPAHDRVVAGGGDGTSRSWPDPGANSFEVTPNVVQGVPATTARIARLPITEVSQGAAARVTGLVAAEPVARAASLAFMRYPSNAASTSHRHSTVCDEPALDIAHRYLQERAPGTSSRLATSHMKRSAGHDIEDIDDQLVLDGSRTTRAIGPSARDDEIDTQAVPPVEREETRGRRRRRC